MAIPTYDHFIEPRLLARQPEGLPARVAHEQAADALGIPAPERQELVPSGAQPIYKDRGLAAQAQDFARSVEGIVLIDGSRLASLMVDYELGVSSRVAKIPKIDSDYFGEELS